VGRVVVKSV